MELNKEKQIEEMALTDVDILANDINQHCPDLAENYCGGTHCVACLANALIGQGYRKASEVARDVFNDLNEMWHKGRGFIDYSDLVKLERLHEQKYTEEGK